MRRALAVRTPRGHAVLTTTGRKTGKQRRNYIRAIRRGDTVYAVMLRPPSVAIERPLVVTAWILNVRADPNVRVRFGWRTRCGVARELADGVELERARQAFCETVHLVDYGECALHLRGRPTREKIEHLHRYWFDTGIPLIIELTRSHGSPSLTVRRSLYRLARTHRRRQSPSKLASPRPQS